MPNNTPFNYTYDLVPSDTVDLPKVSPHFGFTEAIFVGGAGIVAAVEEDGSVTQFTAVAGQILPIKAKRVNAAVTTATLLRGMNTI